MDFLVIMGVSTLCAMYLLFFFNTYVSEKQWRAAMKKDFPEIVWGESFWRVCFTLGLLKRKAHLNYRA